MEEAQKKFKSILTSPEIVLEYITEKPLNFDAIRDNPILKPVSEINKNYCDLHLTATKAILEYEEEYKKIQEMEVINPRYTNTVLMATIKNMITLMKTIVHSQDLQNISMRSAINEMIDISDSKYKFMNDEKERIEKITMQVRKDLEKEYKSKIENQPKQIQVETGHNVGASPTPMTDVASVDNFGSGKVTPVPIQNEDDEEYEKTLSDLKKIAGEGEPEKKEVIPDKPKKVYSTLLEREI